MNSPHALLFHLRRKLSETEKGYILPEITLCGSSLLCKFRNPNMESNEHNKDINKEQIFVITVADITQKV